MLGVNGGEGQKAEEEREERFLHEGVLSFEFGCGILIDSGESNIFSKKDDRQSLIT